MSDHKCKECKFYRKETINYGECLLRPPIYTGSLNPDHPDSWARPRVWLDDFCGDFSEEKIVKPKRKPKNNDDQLEFGV